MPQSEDPFDLQRFIDAQAPVIEDALAELRAGRKRTHWMWFVFPQIAGLGSSAMAVRYAIGSPAEARAYLAHPVLGDRLRECVRLVVATSRPLADVFGHPDDMKFRSCVTLFAAVAPAQAVFAEALDRCCGVSATPRRSKSSERSSLDGVPIADPKPAPSEPAVVASGGRTGSRLGLKPNDAAGMQEANCRST